MKPIAPASPNRGIHGTIRSRSLSALLLATALAAPLGLEPRAVAQSVHETQMAKQPVDVVMTPNGRLAIVRGHAPGNDRIDGITVVDTSTGNKLLLQGSHPNAGLGGYRNPSDFVQATNSRAILIGGRDTDAIPGEDTTYVDVLAFDMATTPPTVTCISHHELGGTSQPAELGTGLDVGHFGLDPLAEIASFGGKGKVWAVDSMVRRRAVAGSVAEDVQFGTGFVHIVRP